jgi:hypothetical protein
MSGFINNLSNYPPGISGNEPEITGEPRRPRLRKYRSHWSDNHNQLDEPSCVTNAKEQWPLPWVYFFASSLKAAKARVQEFNLLLMPMNAPQPAHCPTLLLARHGFMKFPAGPLADVDSEYLV